MRYLLPAVASMLMLGFACGGGDEAEEDEVKAEADAATDEGSSDEGGEADEGEAHPTPPRGKIGKARGVSFAEAERVCCTHDRIDKVLTEYLDVQENLYEDRPTTGDANALWGHLDAAAKDDSLPPASRGAARRAADLLHEVKDGDNDAIREHFDEVSVEVYNLVTNHEGRGSHTVAYVFCPAAGGKYWFQTASTVQNPYKLGGAASRCGQFQR